MGRLTDLARSDWKRLSSAGGFEEQIIFETPVSFVIPKTATINGLHTKHHLSMDTDGNKVSSKNTHITFNEDLLNELDYPVRNAKNEVSLINHVVSVKDSTGVLKKYVVLENYPDETVGMITCILGDCV